MFSKPQSQHIFQTSTYTAGTWTYPNQKIHKTSDSSQNFCQNNNQELRKPSNQTRYTGFYIYLTLLHQKSLLVKQ